MVLLPRTLGLPLTRRRSCCLPPWLSARPAVVLSCATMAQTSHPAEGRQPLANLQPSPTVPTSAACFLEHSVGTTAA